MTTTTDTPFDAACAFRREAETLRIRARAAFLLGRFADASNLAADADAAARESSQLVRQVTRDGRTT